MILVLSGQNDRGNIIYRIAPDNRRCLIRLFTAVCLGLAHFIVAPGSIAQDQILPLEPADTNSPRSTLANLVDNITEAHRVLGAAEMEHESSSGLFKSDAVIEQERQAMFLLERAAGSLNFSEVPRATRQFVAVEAALQLMEVLDRLPLPPLESIPDEKAVAARGIARWRVPRTNINIVRVEEGARVGVGGLAASGGVAQRRRTAVPQHDNCAARAAGRYARLPASRLSRIN